MHMDETEHSPSSLMDYDIVYFLTSQQVQPTTVGDTASSRSGSCLATVRSAVAGALPPERVYRTLEPPRTKRAWQEFVLVHLPILRWLWSYQLTYLPNDIIAGVTIAVMQLPQGLAYAVVANLDPVYGLYTAIVPVIVYSIFGTSRHVSIGVVTVISLLVGNSVNQVLAKIGFSICSDATKSTHVAFQVDNVTNITCGDLKGEIAISLAMTSGLIMFGMGLLHLGFVTVFLSEPLIAGYVTASGMITFTTQIANIFGMKINLNPVVPNYPDILSVPRTLIEALRQIFHWPKYINTATFVISLISILLLIALRIVNLKAVSKIKCAFCRYSRSSRTCSVSRTWKWPLPIPSPLLLIIIGILLSYFFNFQKKFKVAVVGTVPARLPPISYPRGDYMLMSIPNAIVLAIVTYAVGLSLVKVIGKRFGYSIDSNQELWGYGLANIIGSLFSSFNVGTSISRTLVQAAAKGKTQVVGLVSALLISASLVLFGGLLSSLPKAILAAIIWVALYSLFKQCKDIWIYFKTSFPDMLVWLVVFISTVLLGVDLGFAVGVVFSLLVVVFKIVLTHTTFYAGAMNGKINVPPGILVYVFQSPLCFLNAAVFTENLEAAVGIKPKRNGLEKNGCVKQIITKLALLCQCINEGLEISTFRLTPFMFAILGPLLIWNCIRRRRDEDQISNAAAATSTNLNSTRFHTVVIDCAAIGFLDAVGTQTLIQVVLDFKSRGIVIKLASLSNENRTILTRCGFDEKCDRASIFATVREAINSASLQQIESPTMIDVDMMLGQLESGDVSTARPMQTPDHIMVVAETAFLSGSESEQEYITAVHTRIGSGLW